MKTEADFDVICPYCECPVVVSVGLVSGLCEEHLTKVVRCVRAAKGYGGCHRQFVATIELKAVWKTYKMAGRYPETEGK